MKRIKLPSKKKSKIARAFGVSKVTVWNALNYITDSGLARKIRRAALAEGGVVEEHLVVPEGFMPNCEVSFDHADGQVQRVVQTFSNGIRLVLDGERHTAVIFRRNQPIRTHEDVAIQDWVNIAFEAQSYSMDSLNR